MKSVYFKNFVMTAMLVVISFFLLGTSIVVLGRNFALNQKRESIALNASELSKAASAFCEENGDLTDWYLRLIISSLAKSTGNDIFITDVQGTIVSSSDMDVISPYIGKQISPGIMEVLYKNGKFQKLTTLDNFYNERPYYVVALPIVIGANNALTGYIFVGSDCTAIIDAWGTASAVFVTTAAIVMLLPLIGNVTVEEWQDEQIKQLQQKQTVYNEAAERRKTIETRLQTIDSILPQDIDDGTKIDDEPSELRKAKRLLGRLETTIFEKSVEPQLQSIKRDYHVVDIYREARQDSGSVRFRVIYKSELQFHLFIFYQLFGCAKVRDASFLCIDEGQDLSSFDYSLLSILQPKAIKNIYGDIGQVLHDGAGIRNWNNIEFSEYK